MLTNFNVFGLIPAAARCIHGIFLLHVKEKVRKQKYLFYIESNNPSMIYITYIFWGCEGLELISADNGQEAGYILDKGTSLQ